MEQQSTNIQCPNCMSDVPLDRSTFYKMAGTALRCPECDGQIQIPADVSWQEFSNPDKSDERDSKSSRKSAVISLSSKNRDQPQKPQQAANPQPSQTFSQPPQRKFNITIVVVVAVLLVSLLAILSLRTSTPEPTVPAPVHPLPVVKTTTSTTVPPVQEKPVVALTAEPAIPAPSEEELSSEAFEAYTGSLMRGEFSDAEKSLRTLRSVFSSISKKNEFWRENFPTDRLRTLRIETLCPACLDSDGKCSPCSGSGVCASCKGGKICPSCKNKPTRERLCRACSCRKCSASGICLACQGTGSMSCRSCNGTGNLQISERQTCKSCGGRGTKAGLRGANNEPTTLQCLSCRGRTYVIRPRSVECSACNGTKWTPCNQCNGSGICPVCKGLGNKRPCTVCDGSGKTIITCSACAGSGQCVSCNGTAKCGTCSGSGVCASCKGRTLLIAYELPVLSDWVIQDKGCIIVGADGTLDRKATATGKIQLKIGSRSASTTVRTGEIVVITENDAASAAKVIKTF